MSEMCRGTEQPFAEILLLCLVFDQSRNLRPWKQSSIEDNSKRLIVKINKTYYLE